MSEQIEIPRADLDAAGRKVVVLGEREILVFEEDGRFFAIDNFCPHAQGRLENARIEDGTITCMHHGSCFDLETGALRLDKLDEDLLEMIDEDEPPFGPIRFFPVECRGGTLFVELP